MSRCLNSAVDVLRRHDAVVGIDIEDNGNEAPDTLHSHRLGMQVEDGGNLMEEGIVQITITTASTVMVWTPSSSTASTVALCSHAV